MRTGNQSSGEEPGSPGPGPADARVPREPERRRGRRSEPPEGRGWLGEPRTAVLLILGGVVLVGGGRRLLHAWNARRGIARLSGPDVTPEEIAAVVPFGRAALPELFRLFGESSPATTREAAGRAVAALWAEDQLIAEEEQALVRRGYEVSWTARRRYPRAIHTGIPIEVAYGLEFLRPDGPGIKPTNLEWSHRITEARQASLEEFTAWSPGPGRARFTILPDDFETNGPHRLVLQARVRTAGLSSRWQIDLPHAPFSFELDPRLDPAALLASPDETRAGAFARALRLEADATGDEGPAHFLPLNDGLAIRNPPRLAVAPPLPCDLAHRISLELEGVAGTFPAGAVILGGQGAGRGGAAQATIAPRSFPIGPVADIPPELLDRPGRRRVRLRLEPDPELGWTDPAVRSVWPGTLATDWHDADILRR